MIQPKPYPKYRVLPQMAVSLSQSYKGYIPGLECRLIENIDLPHRLVWLAYKMNRRGDEFRQGKKYAIAVPVPDTQDIREMSKWLAESVGLANDCFLNVARTKNRKVWYKTATAIVEVTKDGKIGKVFSLDSKAVQK